MLNDTQLKLEPKFIKMSVRSLTFLVFCCSIVCAMAKPLSWLEIKQGRYTCPASDGFYGIEGRCVSEYYICVDGVAYLQRCPGENVFDPETGRCVPLVEASCQNLPTTVSTTLPPSSSTTRGSTSTVSSSSTITSTPSTITSTTVSSTITTVTSLNTGTTPWLTVDTTPTTSSTTPGGEIIFTCPTDNGFFPFPDACTNEYIICVSGAPYIGTCPEGAIFDPVTLICTSAGQASCSAFKCPTPDGFFPIPGACSNNYYLCIADVPYLENCPGDSIFDPALSACVPAQSASCTTTTPNRSTTVYSTTMRTTTPYFTCNKFTCQQRGKKH